MSDVEDGSGLVPEGDRNSEVVTIGTSTQGIPIQLFQHVYNEITGKNEKLTQYHNEAIILDFGDLEQLNIKIHQTLRPHTVRAVKYSFIIYFSEGSKE